MTQRAGSDDGGLPYRSPITVHAPAPQVSSDEQDYNTLKSVHEIFATALEGLYKDFNAFDVLSEGTDQAKIETMMRQIAGKQIAFDILSPLLERVKNAMGIADENYKQRNQK